MKRKANTSTTITNKASKKKSISKTKTPAVHSMEDVQKLIHLLQVNQIELEHQNQELRSTEQELEISRNKYVNLFDFSPIPYFALDPEGTIKEVNLYASKILGIERIKLPGKKFYTFIPPSERDIFKYFIKNVFNDPARQSCKLTVIIKDKHLFQAILEGLEIVDTLTSERKCLVALIDVKE